jgi:hypothetical protein
MRNRLAREKSPYLLQHASNPVDWYPWGKEAFEKAKKEDKPIFLSIGYSTCHWCHVMARESFEDPEVAALMNEVFVSIKVDREERPDIDEVYMQVCHMLTGSGGWPLTIVMTPDKKPFFASTYLPKKGRFGRVGMVELTSLVKELWDRRRKEVLSSAGKIAEVLKRSQKAVSGEMPKEEVLDRAFQELAAGFDEDYGGFGKAPKFPMAPSLLFLLRYWKRKRRNKTLKMVVKTLKEMQKGGIYDHVGFGFHRYSTDRRWVLPHFEKMLYDQGLLAMTYLEAYQETGDEDFGRTAREVFTYVLRDMKSPEGGFYSAEDAESGGEEGGFYLWGLDEVFRVLGKEEGELVARVFGLKEEGNFLEEASGITTGKNILRLREPLSIVAFKMGMREEDLRKRLEGARRKLFAARGSRIRPGRDDKILADWNGLMIAALAKGAQVFDEPGYAEAAEKAMDFILINMSSKDGRLFHRYREGEAGIPGYLDDYVFVIWGLLELYEATFRWEYLRHALRLNRVLLKHFWDKGKGGFFFTPDDAEKLLIRKKAAYDGSIPSGNAVAMLNLLRLAKLTAEEGLEERSADLARSFSGDISRSPGGHPFFMVAVDFALGPTYEVVISGDRKDKNTRAMLRAIGSRFLPRKVVALLGEEVEDLPPFLGEILKQGKKGETIAYVCRGYTCEKPVKTVKELIDVLGD